MKGCQKKVIFLKNTGSELFDEAYFIISRESEKEAVEEDSMIVEANKIISASIECENTGKGLLLIKRAIKNAVPFIIGAASSAAVILLLR